MISDSANHVLIVKNAKAGTGARHELLRQLVGQLEARHLRPELVEDVQTLEVLVEQYRSAGMLRAIIAAGGDGTVAEVVNRTRPDVPITVFPLGTANLLASYVGISADPAALAATVDEGYLRRLDAGSANGRIFLLMVGCGFDADVVHRLHRRRTSAGINYWTYARPILESIRSYRYPDLRVYCDPEPGLERSGELATARWVLVSNLPCYAAGLQFAPDAVGDDGLLTVSTFRNGSLWHGLRYLAYALLRRTRAIPDYRTQVARRVRIESHETVPYQLDGDPGGTLPLEIEVLPGRLTMIVPRSSAR